MTPSVNTPSLDRLNRHEDAVLDGILLEVCSSPTWARLVRLARPYRSPEDLHAANAAAMDALGEPDLREAMAGHARIGKPKQGDATSQREQSGVHGAEQALLDELAEANAAYETRFGHVFLICATGRTAGTMLAALRERQDNDPAKELEIVRGELRKINDIRLTRLLEEDA